MSNHWQVQKAKAQFSRLIDRAMRHGPQFVTKHGRAAVVVLSAQDYKRSEQPSDTLVEFFQHSPLRGAKLDLRRDKGNDREVHL